MLSNSLVGSRRLGVSANCPVPAVKSPTRIEVALYRYASGGLFRATIRSMYILVVAVIRVKIN